MTTTVYGIKNCNTMKKAFAWLDENGVSYEFHDYKKQGADPTVLEEALKQHEWAQVINKRGMTWRNLTEEQKKNINENNAVELALEKTSIIKRPLLVHDEKIYLGFDEDQYAEIFA